VKIHQVLTPEQVVIEYRIAELPVRVMASIVDLLWQLIGILVIVLVNLTIYSYFELFYFSLSEWFIAVSLILCALTIYGYGVFFEYGGSGQTPGKKKVGIRTIRLNGEPVSLAHVAIRNFFKYFIDGFGIGLWWMLFDPKGRRWGDMVSSTIVVYEAIQ